MTLFLIIVKMCTYLKVSSFNFLTSPKHSITTDKFCSLRYSWSVSEFGLDHPKIWRRKILSVAAELAGIDNSFNVNLHKSPRIALYLSMHCHHTSALTLFIVDSCPRSFEMGADSDINWSKSGTRPEVRSRSISWAVFIWSHLRPFPLYTGWSTFCYFFQPIFSNIIKVPNWVFLLHSLC